MKLPTPYDAVQTKLSVVWWIGIALAGVLLIGTAEACLRSAGFESGPHDDDLFWAQHRLSVDTLGKKSVVILGSSRCQADVIVDQLSQSLSRQVVQLGIAGASPLPVLEDLAKSEYTGLVVLSVSPQHVFSDSVQRTGKSRDWVARYREVASSPGERIELRISLAARDMAVLRQDFNWRTVVNRYVLAGETAPRENWAHETRWARFPDVMKGNRRGVKVPIPQVDQSLEGREALIRRFRVAIELIAQRGGQTIIVRPPSTGADYAKIGLVDTEKQFMPRAEFYDRLVRACDVAAYHADDISELAELYGADGSHLCESDAAIFTAWLSTVIHGMSAS